MQKLLFTLIFTFIGLWGFSQAIKALIIGVDGCRVDALQLANTPNLDQLIANSVYSPDALNDDITISGPGWSAILCGVWSDKHLVTGNNFTVNDYDSYPSLFKRLETADSSIHTVSICHWGPINNEIIGDFADFKSNVSTDAEVAQQGASYLTVNNPDLMFLHFDDVDHAGHSNGFSPEVPAYMEAIEQVDSYIGTVLEGLVTRPDYANEDWLIIVTTDHGGLGFSHGGNSIEEKNVFLILQSSRVAPTVIRKDSMVVYNVPENCLGDTVALQFEGESGQVQIPSSPIFDFGADQDFTIECRVLTDQAGDVAIVGNKNWQSGVNPGFVFSFKYPSGPEWKVNIGDGTNRADLNNGGLIADGAWHTLSVTFDRDGYMVMYEDGIVIDSIDISNIGNINTNQGLFMGTDPEGNFPYQGAIAETRVWNSVLDDQTINEWHCMQLNDAHPAYEQLIGYWKLNEGDENVEVLDWSENDNHGIISQANWVSLDSSVTFDYSQTPRLTDVAATVMTHFCLPIQESWALDGQSLIPECLTTATTNQKERAEVPFKLVPNPAREATDLYLSTTVETGFQLKIRDVNGKIVFEKVGFESRTSLNLTKLPAGIYWVELQIKEKSWTQKLVRSD